MKRPVIWLILLVVAFWVVKWLTAPAQTATPPQGSAAPESRQVLVFSASWCGPCRRDKPKREELARHVPVTYIDVDNDPDQKAAEFGIKVVPTYLVFERGPNGFVEQLRTTNIGEVFRFLSL